MVLLLRQQGRREAAARAYEEALASDPNIGEVRRQLPEALAEPWARPIDLARAGVGFLRLNPAIQPIKTSSGWTVPPLLASAPPGSKVLSNFNNDADAFQALIKLDMDAVGQDDVDLIQTLGNAWIANAAPNQCIRTNGDLQPLIGHGTFSAGVAQARTLGLA